MALMACSWCSMEAGSYPWRTFSNRFVPSGPTYSPASLSFDALCTYSAPSVTALRVLRVSDPARHRGASVARPVGHAGVALDFLHRQMTGHGHDLVNGAAPLCQVGQAAFAKAVGRAARGQSCLGDLRPAYGMILPSGSCGRIQHRLSHSLPSPPVILLAIGEVLEPTRLFSAKSRTKKSSCAKKEETNCCNRSGL